MFFGILFCLRTPKKICVLIFQVLPNILNNMYLLGTIGCVLRVKIEALLTLENFSIFHQSLTWKPKFKYMKEPEHIVTIFHNFVAINYCQTIFGWDEDPFYDFQKMGQKFLSDPQKPPYGQKFLPQRVKNG